MSALSQRLLQSTLLWGSARGTIRGTIASVGTRTTTQVGQCFSTSAAAEDLRVKPYVSGESTHFGFEQVNIEDKESKVRQVFDNVADSYDIMNDVMSAGVHRLWKDYLLDVSQVETLAKAARAAELDFKMLDVAGGTGDGR